MTKDQLQARITQLQTEQVQMNSTYAGAIQDCQYWLQQLEAPSVEPSAPATAEESN